MIKVNLSNYDQSWYSKGRSSIVIIFWWFVQASFFSCSLHNMYNYRNFILRLFGAKIGKGVKVRASARFHYPWKIEIGDYSWIGDHAQLYSLDRIKIGSNCVISQDAYLCTGSHDLESESFQLIVKPIIIEDYAWVAADTFVAQGVTIKEGGVIAARSSIYKDTEPWWVYMGNPAKSIKKREIVRK